MEGLTISEMAQMLGVKEGVIRQRLVYANIKAFSKKPLYTQADFEAIKSVKPKGWPKQPKGGWPKKEGAGEGGGPGCPAGGLPADNRGLSFGRTAPIMEYRVERPGLHRLYQRLTPHFPPAIAA